MGVAAAQIVNHFWWYSSELLQVHLQHISPSCAMISKVLSPPSPNRVQDDTGILSKPTADTPCPSFVPYNQSKTRRRVHARGNSLDNKRDTAIVTFSYQKMLPNFPKSPTLWTPFCITALQILKKNLPEFVVRCIFIDKILLCKYNGFLTVTYICGSGIKKNTEN